MNDSNNNIFDTKNSIPTTPSQPLNNVNPISETNNNNVQPQQNTVVNNNQENLMPNFNSLFVTSNTSEPTTNNVIQPNQNLGNNIPNQLNNNLQPNNINQTQDVSTTANQQNLISPSPIPGQKVDDNISSQSNQNTNNNVLPQNNNNSINLTSNLNSTPDVSNMFVSAQPSVSQQSQNLNSNTPVQSNNTNQLNQEQVTNIPITPIPQQKNENIISQQYNQNINTSTQTEENNQNINTSTQTEENNQINLTPNFNPTADFNNMFVSAQNDVSQQNQNNNITASTNPNQQNTIPINPISEVKGESNTQTQPNENITNNDTSNQNINTISKDDEELLKAFIGNNYEKIKNSQFNIAGFFFTTFYMFYRKMFGYALLAFLIDLVLLNLINKFYISFVLNILIGLFVNKIYLSYANKQISKIKLKNNDKDINELKNICSKKGGTSVGKIFLGFLAELAIIIVVLFIMMAVGFGSVFGQLINLDNWNIISNNTNISTKNATLMEDVSVSGYSCIGSNCSVTIYDSNDNEDDYTLKISNSDLFNKLSSYEDYIKLDIYYTKKGEEKTIVDYKIYLKSNNEDISNITKEDELREKIGLYSIGTHTDSLKLTEIGFSGVGYNDDESYSYTSYTFVNSQNIEYEMNYINKDGEELNLVEGNEYNVTFEVAEGTFDYEYTIISIN